MKNLTKTMIVALTIFTSAVAMAGGGGGNHQCQDGRVIPSWKSCDIITVSFWCNPSSKKISNLVVAIRGSLSNPDYRQLISYGYFVQKTGQQVENFASVTEVAPGLFQIKEVLNQKKGQAIDILLAIVANEELQAQVKGTYTHKTGKVEQIDEVMKCNSAVN